MTAVIRNLFVCSLIVCSLTAWSVRAASANVGAASVDAFAFGFSPRTGDAFLDAELGDTNVLVRGGTDGFVDDVVVRFAAPRPIVRTYVVERRWAPADVYYACAIAQHLRRPCVEMLRVYERDHRLGWGAVARRLGIRPGSRAFHALKGNVSNGHAKYKRDRGHRQHQSGPGHAKHERERSNNERGHSDTRAEHDKRKPHGSHSERH